MDTTLLVDLLREDPKARAFVEAQERKGVVLWVPSPALFEIWEGAERADRGEPMRRLIESVIGGYTQLAFEPRHAVRAGAVSGQLVRRGEMLDPVDAQIGGTALEERLPVVTRNVRHFERIPDLKVETY